jgi:hypothetical protein
MARMSAMAATARFMCGCAGHGASGRGNASGPPHHVMIGPPLQYVMIVMFAAGPGGIAMAKGQMRSTKEKKKPKAAWNKKKKGGPAPVSSAAQSQPVSSAFGKKP